MSLRAFSLNHKPAGVRTRTPSCHNIITVKGGSLDNPRATDAKQPPVKRSVYCVDTYLSGKRRSMGNGSSREVSSSTEDDKRLKGGSQDTTVTSEETTTIIDRRPRSGSTSRRIVKAAHPKPIVDTALIESQPNKQQDDEKDNDKPLDGSWRPIPASVAENSPSIARELDQEMAKKVKQERMQTAAERQRLKREKEKEERRKNQPHRQSNVKPNPMSRFLSAFSVQPQHPEHKRCFEKPAEKEEYPEPLEKRLRSSDSSAPGEGESTSTSDNTIWTRTTVASAVAVTAIAVAVVLRWTRSK